MPRTYFKAATCHPDRDEHAKGYCFPCYMMIRRTGDVKRVRVTISRGAPKALECRNHPGRPPKARDLCGSCLTAKSRLRHPESKERQRESARRSHQKHRDVICAKRRAWYVKNRDYALAKNKEWRESLSIHERRNLKLKKYGITHKDYLEILAAQGGHCAICESDTGLCVDHCHKTGKVRGVLCVRCNTMAGYVDNDSDKLDALRKYIDASNA